MPSGNDGSFVYVPSSSRQSEPPPSESPISGVIGPFFTMLDGGASAQSGPSSRRQVSEQPPASGPMSGQAAPVLFRGDAGPGFWIRDPKAGVEVVFADASLGTCKVIRLSPTGAWFTPNRDVPYPTEDPLELSLRAGAHEIGPLFAEVVMPPSPVHDPVFGLTFTGLQFRVAQQLVALLRALATSGAAQLAHRPQQIREEVIDAPRIRAIVKALAGVGSRGFVGARRDAPVSITSLDDEGLLHWQGTSDWGAGPLTVELTGYNSVYRLHLSKVTVVGEGELVTPIPTRIERTRQRQYRRSEVDGGVLKAVFSHPLWSRLPQIVTDVRDVSFGGIRVITSLASLDDDEEKTVRDQLLFPGLSLPMIDLRDERGDSVRLKGEVRSVGISGGEAVARISVSPFASRDENRWNRLVARLLYPTTQSGGDWAESVWDLFRDSGYFNLSGKTPEHFEELRSSYMRVDQQGAVTPKLFCHAVFPSGRGVEGTVSIMKVYRSTWMLHQLAKRRGGVESANSRQILRDLYTRAFEHTQTDQKFQWVIAYAEATVRWNQLSHFDFAQRHSETGKAISLPFQLMEANVFDAGMHVPAVAEIGRATAEEVGLVLDHIRSTRPSCYVEALDLAPDCASLSEVSREWMRAGLSRTRSIFVARRDGAPVAASIVECSETGANLFRLTDCLRLVVLAPGGDAALPGLLDGARNWFAEHGKEAFVYFREDEDPGPAEVVKLRDLGEGRFWVIAAELLPEFLEHLFEVTSAKKMTAKQADEAAPGRPSM